MTTDQINSTVTKLLELAKSICLIDAVYETCKHGIVFHPGFYQTALKSLPDEGFTLDTTNIQLYNNDLERMRSILTRYRRKAFIMYRELIHALPSAQIEPNDLASMVSSMEGLMKNAKVI